MTGFYVANVVSRYWDQFVSLPWPDRLAFKIVTFIPGKVRIFLGIGQEPCGQSYKQFTIVNYDSRVVIWANL